MIAPVPEERDRPRDYPHAYAATLCPSEYSRWGGEGGLVFYCSVSSLLVNTELF